MAAVHGPSGIQPTAHLQAAHTVAAGVPKVPIAGANLAAMQPNAPTPATSEKTAMKLDVLQKKLDDFDKAVFNDTIKNGGALAVFARLFGMGFVIAAGGHSNARNNIIKEHAEDVLSPLGLKQKENMSKIEGGIQILRASVEASKMSPNADAKLREMYAPEPDGSGLANRIAELKQTVTEMERDLVALPNPGMSEKLRDLKQILALFPANMPNPVPAGQNQPRPNSIANNLMNRIADADADASDRAILKERAALRAAGGAGGASATDVANGCSGLGALLMIFFR